MSNSDSEPEEPGLVSREVIEQVMRTKKGDPSMFESYWEMDEDNIEEWTMSEIQSDPKKRIIWAAENNKLDEVAKLLEGGDSLVHSKDNDGYTPLHRASYNGHVDMARLLLSKGADVHAKTNDGWEPLHSAVRWDQVEVASLLLQGGASVNALTNGGQSPLHIAASQPECRRVMELLLFNPFLSRSALGKNNGGETPLQLANHHGSFGGLTELMENSVRLLINSD